MAEEIQKEKKFFVHVNVISDLFKNKFLHYLNKAYEKGELNFEGKIAYLQAPAEFKKLKDKLYAKRWVTFCKPPFGGPEEVLEYLGRYTHRVATSVLLSWKMAESTSNGRTTAKAASSMKRRWRFVSLFGGSCCMFCQTATSRSDITAF